MLSGWGALGDMWGGTRDNQTLSLTHARNPLPWCDEISTAEAHRDGHKGQGLAQGLWGQILSVSLASM